MQQMSQFFVVFLFVQCTITIGLVCCKISKKVSLFDSDSEGGFTHSFNKNIVHWIYLYYISDTAYP